MIAEYGVSVLEVLAYRNPGPFLSETSMHRSVEFALTKQSQNEFFKSASNDSLLNQFNFHNLKSKLLGNAEV